MVPPPLRAKKSIVLKRLDHEITGYDTDEIKDDLENRNIWAKVEEIVKFRNIAHILKVRFRDIAMAQKAISSGLCLFAYHLSPSQIEQAEFYSITPCWPCYKYDHQVHDCPDKDLTICSGCSETGHIYRGCRNRDRPKCLNCKGAHRTLAASCPIHRDIKKKRDESKQRKSQVRIKPLQLSLNYNKTFPAW